jgi:hypothetical protein
MAWRVIVRFSLDKDRNSVVRNQIAKILDDSGINKTATGTWESKELDEMQAAKTLADVVTGLAKAPRLKRGTHLDHFWIYVDSVK